MVSIPFSAGGHLVGRVENPENMKQSRRLYMTTKDEGPKVVGSRGWRKRLSLVSQTLPGVSNSVGRFRSILSMLVLFSRADILQFISSHDFL